MILQIASRELRSLFLSPLAWIIMGIVQGIMAWKFLGFIDYFFELQPDLINIKNAPGVTDLIVAPLFDFSKVLLLIICPLITMRLLSEEKQSGSLKLLLSSPVSMTEIVLGKYLGALSFFSIIILLISLMPLSLLSSTDLDMGKFASGMLGQFLTIAAFISLGLYMSSLSSQPANAAAGTFGLLILLLIINIAGSATTEGNNFFNYLSITHHSIQMLRGIVNTADIAYFILFSLGFILLSIRQLDSQRLQS
ncbi:MAG: ABC transporter permease [endosymbiont of Galathealinum brachiosum]|uniref:ABC transporter permease n=1 Tax=endosymbiont of Galathealinum brachiosum TaxID=2200906 RepID=A0A370DDI3_9GAMM|nr:MAG: ABC transporter permease [endosymbiont of Galathealinum brachiosum]